MADTQPPVILLAFTNPYLRGYHPLEWLIIEERELRAILQPAARAGRCELVEIPNATLKEVLDAFQDPHIRGRVAVFHFAGHGGPDRLLLEERTGTPLAADAGGIAAFLAQQPGLRLAFLNACSTAEQVQALHAAGVPAVAATDLDVPDVWALALAVRFYKALAGGSTLASAFAEAEAEVHAQYGGNREGERWPWRLHLRTEEDGAWKLPARRARREEPVPLQRPLRVQHFTGREEELARLLADLAPGRILALCGPGGMGKSALAAEAVWRLAPGDEPPERFPDGLLFHTFYHQPQAAQALEKIARAFAVDPRPTPRDAAIQALAGKQALIVLDGAEAADDLESVLAVIGGCGVLITTRRRADAPDSIEDLGPLERQESLHLLRAWAGPYAADDAAAGEIAGMLGGLPLALFLAGRYLAQRRQKASEFVAWLMQTGLPALHFADRATKSIPLLMERSLAQVSEDARTAFRLTGVLALAPFDGETVAAGLAIIPAATHRALGDLVDYGLLLRPGDSYQVTHALAHSYARSQDVAPAALIRLAALFSELAQHANEMGADGLAAFDRQRAHAIAVQAAALKAGLWEEVIQMAWCLKNYLNLTGYASDWIPVGEAGLAAARHRRNRLDEGAFLHILGNAHFALGQPRRAVELYEQHLGIAQELGSLQEQSTALRSLGRVYLELGEVPAAIEFHEQSLAISRSIGDLKNEGLALVDLGVAHTNLGHTQRSIELYQQALEIARKLGDREGEVNALSSLGRSYGAMGEARRAIELHEQCLIILREIGDRRGEASTLGNLGKAFLYLGDARRSAELFEQKLAISRAISYRRGEGSALGNLGVAYSVLGDTRHAVEIFEQRLEIAREIGDRRGEGYCYGDIGNAYLSLGDLPKAIDAYEHQLSLVRTIGYRRGEGAALGHLGRAHLAGARPEVAIPLLEQYLAIMQEIGNRRGVGAALGYLGWAKAQAGDGRTSLLFCQQSLEIRQSIGDRIGEGEALIELGYAHFAVGNYLHALEHQTQAVALLADTSAQEQLCWALTDLAETQLALKEPGAAWQQAQRAAELADSCQYRLRLAAALWVQARDCDDRSHAIEYAQQALKLYIDLDHANAGEVRRQLNRWQVT